MARGNSAVTTEKLADDLWTVMADCEELVKELAGDLSEKGKEARGRLMAKMEVAKATCGQVQKQAQAGLEAADTLVHEHPYTAVGIGFGVGLLIGVLVARQ